MVVAVEAAAVAAAGLGDKHPEAAAGQSGQMAALRPISRSF